MNDFDLTITCPTCSARNEDPFEVLQRNTPDHMNCHACQRPIYLLITYCEACAHEEVLTSVLPIQTRALGRCVKCGEEVDEAHEEQRAG